MFDTKHMFDILFTFDITFYLQTIHTNKLSMKNNEFLFIRMTGMLSTIKIFVNLHY